jgi:hypothetical protein
MNKPTLILAASLAANGLLAGTVVWSFSRSTGRPARSEVARAQPAVASEAGNSGAGSSTATVADHATATDPKTLGAGVTQLVALFNSGDPQKLAAALREAGLPEDVVRMLVREQIATRYRARIRAIEQEARGGDRPWWQGSGRTEITAAQRSEIRQLQRDMQAEISRALGTENVTDRRGRYAYLSTDKAELITRIDSDYGELASTTREAMEGFPLPSDREALRLLQDERRKDIAGLLSPDELREYDMRTSQIANRIQREFGGVIASEDEYRAIYKLAEAFDAQFGRGAEGGELDRRDRTAAENDLRQQILEMLGPERAQQYAQQRDSDYRTMQAATARLNLPPEATDRVLTLRAQTAQQSQIIAADAALDGAQRRVALDALAAQVRGQLGQTLGAEGAQAFAQRSEWLRALEHGAAFKVLPEGGVSVIGNAGRGSANGSRPGGPPGNANPARPRGGGG